MFHIIWHLWWFITCLYRNKEISPTLWKVFGSNTLFLTRCLIWYDIILRLLLTLMYCKGFSSVMVKANFTTSKKRKNPELKAEPLLNPKTGADVYHFEMPQHLRQCHMKTHKSQGEWQLAAVSLQQSLIFKCLLYWAQSSHKMKSCFFDEREIEFPRMLCLVGKAENQLSCRFSKHFIFHHLNFWNCG